MYSISQRGGWKRAALIAAVSVTALGLSSPAGAQSAQPQAARFADTDRIRIERIGDGPVIYPDMPGLTGENGKNINGPSVIKVPDWVKKPLGRYYMYFAHHRGTYIRLAYADSPTGPWTIHEPGTLKLDQTIALDHIASPDVRVDEVNQQFVLYFHGPVEKPGTAKGRPYGQPTFIATSPDGLIFTAGREPVAAPYFRAFDYRGTTYGLGMSDKIGAYPRWLRSGQFFRAQPGRWEAGPRIVSEMRHPAVVVRGDTLHVFYTIVGARPERIQHVEVDLRSDWREWTAGPALDLLWPEKTYEGADLPLVTSRAGMVSSREHALRDPAVLDDDGKVYLYYSVAGESGIAVARLHFADTRAHDGAAK